MNDNNKTDEMWSTYHEFRWLRMKYDEVSDKQWSNEQFVSKCNGC